MFSTHPEPSHILVIFSTCNLKKFLVYYTSVYEILSETVMEMPHRPTTYFFHTVSVIPSPSIKLVISLSLAFLNFPNNVERTLFVLLMRFQLLFHLFLLNVHFSYSIYLFFSNPYSISTISRLETSGFISYLK